jgi:hypothetical protein
LANGGNYSFIRFFFSFEIHVRYNVVKISRLVTVTSYKANV